MWGGLTMYDASAPGVISFNALTSTGVDLTDYDWTFGDGTKDSGVLTDHFYKNPGTYTVTLKVTDRFGRVATASKPVTLIMHIPPVASFTHVLIPSKDTVQFDASSSHASDPGDQIRFYQWNFGDDPAAANCDFDNDPNVTINPIISHKYKQPGTYPVTLTVYDDKGSKGSTTQQVVVAKNPPTAKIKIVSAASGIAPFTALFDSTGSLDPQNLTISLQYDFGDGTVITRSAPGQVPHEFLAAGTYTVTLTVTSAAGLSAKAQTSITAVNPVVPPAPVAPALAMNVVTPVSQATQFLYTGANPVQTGVVANAIDQNRASVMRGRVLDDSGNPLSGVVITVLGAPQFGQTISRADGQFDIVANGGGRVTLNYTRNGYLPASRTVKTKFQNYFIFPDVTLVSPDPKVTVVTLGASQAQIAQGTTQTDSSGSRTATIMIPSQTTAQIVTASGQTIPMSQLSLRATELTVGPNGPNRMPASLPATTSYTYAVDLSSDEERALGAQHIQFSQAVPIYVDNFLKFPAGTIVPVGSYNTTSGQWDPQPNGRVINVLAVANGVASLDVTGSGQASSAANLALLNITSEELAQLGSLYQPGQSFWRSQTDHFSSQDYNWIDGNEDAIGDSAGQPVADQTPYQDPTNQCASGSIIDTRTQVLGEVIPIVGTPITLRYSTTRAQGRSSERTIYIPLTNATPIASLEAITLQIQVAGQTFSQNLVPSPNLNVPFTWNGVDAYGRTLSSAQIATVDVQYQFSSNYFSSTNFANITAPAFSQLNPNFGASTVVSRSPELLESIFQIPIGTQSALNEVSGWTLSVHHFFDPVSNILYFGNGTKQPANPSVNRIVSLAGQAFTAGFSGDGGPASQALLSIPLTPFVASDGSIYFGDLGNDRIRKIALDGTISTVIGNGTVGFSGDGGPATQAEISGGGDSVMAEGSDQSIYFGDFSNFRIRKVDVNGIITTVAGNGSNGYSGDGGQALQAQIGSPEMLAFIGETLYFTSTNNTLRAIAPNGIITTIAGNGTAGFSGDGGAATSALLNNPIGMAVSNAGEFYIADTGNSRIRKISKTGIITTYAGTGSNGTSGDSGPAISAQFEFPSFIALKDDGTLYISDSGANRIRVVAPNGIITTFAGTGSIAGSTNSVGDQGAAIQAEFDNVRGIALGQSGSLIITDSNHQLIRKISPLFPQAQTGTISIPSQSGQEIYDFAASSGQHLQTRNAITGAVKWLFGYDANGLLITATDGDGNATTITRDTTSGEATSITAPFGQVTNLTSDAGGNLASVANPNGETYHIQYTAGGLISQFTKPNGATSLMTYDSFGQLTKDQNALGGFTALTQTPILGGISTLTSTANGRQSSYSSTQDFFGDQLVTHTDGAGFVTSTGSANVESSTATPDGTTNGMILQSDPRLGLPATFASGAQIAVGGASTGLVSTILQSRTVTPNIQSPFAFQETDTKTVNGNVSTKNYNGSTKTYTTTSAMGRVSTKTTDLQSRPLQAQLGTLTPMSFVYDSHGRLSQTSQGPRTTSLAYDSHSNLASNTNSLNQTTSYAYDAAGRMTATQLPDGRVVSYTYDSDGNVTSITPPSRPAHGFVNNLIDLVTSYVAPNIGLGNTTTQYAYSLDKQLTLVTRPDNTTIQYSYDTLTPKVTQITTPLGSYNYGYNSVGQLGTLSSPDGVAMSYGYIGNLVTSMTSTGPVQTSVSYQYNSDLNPLSESAGGSAISFGYDNDRLLTSAGPLSIQRDSQNGLVIGTALGSLQDSTVNDSFGAIQSYQIGSAYSLGLTRDTIGRVVTKSENVGSTSTAVIYSYDPSGRLTQAAQNGGSTNTYQYDANSNRISATIRGQSISATYDAQDRLLTYGQNSYTYNANGDLLAKTDSTGTTNYVYDVFGNLKSVTLPDGTAIAYIVDGLNRRVGKKVNGTLVSQYSFDLNSRINAVYDGSGNLLERFIYGTKSNVPDAMIRTDGTYRLVSDQIGSVRAVVNASSGQVLEQIDYDEFGQVLNDTNPGYQPFGFAGGLYESQTKLVRFGARDYDPETGRFTSKDPLLFGGGSTNLYGYVLNDPINYIDPTGEYNWGPAIGIITGGAVIGWNYLFPPTPSPLQQLQNQVDQQNLLNNAGGQCPANPSSGGPAGGPPGPRNHNLPVGPSGSGA
jgi:RHS repeat-associated protein